MSSFYFALTIYWEWTHERRFARRPQHRKYFVFTIYFTRVASVTDYWYTEAFGIDESTIFGSQTPLVKA